MALVMDRASILWVLFIFFLFGPWVEAAHQQTVLQSFAFPHKERFAQFLVNVTLDPRIRISSKCHSSLVRFANGLNQNEANSLLMFDSFAKLRPGFLSHRYTDFGHYEQCLRNTEPAARYLVLEVDIDPTDANIFLGPRSQIHLAYQAPVVAICLPGSCSESDVSTVLSSELFVSIAEPFKAHVLTSELLGEDQFTDHVTLRYTCRTILVTITTVSVVATLMVTLWPQSFAHHPVLSCFDIVKNTRQIVQQIDPEKSETKFLNGIRAIYLLIAFYGHQICPMSPAIKAYFHPIIDFNTSSDMDIKLAQCFCVLTSFNLILSSSLNVISWKSQFEGQRSISFAKFVFNRVARLYPTLIASLLIVGSFPLFPSLGGPLMNYTQKTSISLLINHGWRQLLFISCFQPVNQMVLVVGWFISTDIQLYAASFFVVYLMYKRPKVGLALALLFFILGTICQWIYLSKSAASPTIYFPTKRFHLFEKEYHVTYFHPLNYIPSYVVGLAFGFLIAQKVAVSRETQDKIWWLSLVTLVTVAPVPAIVYDADGLTSFSRTIELVIGVAVKPIICTALCALLYYYWLNPKSVLTVFFSCRLFTILSRMSFSIFLVHPLQIIFLFASDLEARDYGPSELFFRTLYILLTCLFYGYLMFVLVECPFNQLRQSLRTKTYVRGRKE